MDADQKQISQILWHAFAYCLPFISVFDHRITRSRAITGLLIRVHLRSSAVRFAFPDHRITRSRAITRLPDPRSSASISGKICFSRSPDHPITRDHPIPLR